MPHIEFSVKAGSAGLFLDRKEAAILRPFLLREIKKEQKLREKYRDIREGGDATDRDTDREVLHDENASTLQCIYEGCGQLMD